VTDRFFDPDAVKVTTEDIHKHGYAIVQTRIERIPARYRTTQCDAPDGCTQTATLMTLALAEVVDNPDSVGFRFARDDAGQIVRYPTCDEHRAQASHGLFFELTGRHRPDGIRAFDVPGQYMQWT